MTSRDMLKVTQKIPVTIVTGGTPRPPPGARCHG